MDEKPKDIAELYWKIASGIAANDSSTREKMVQFLKDEGLNSEEVFKQWDKEFELKLVESRANKSKLDQAKKNSEQQKRKPKGPRLS